MLTMFLKCGAIHHDVVQVHDNKMVEERLKHLAHECAKYCGCIGEVEWHDKEFEGPAPCYACSLGFISLGMLTW